MKSIHFYWLSVILCLAAATASLQSQEQVLPAASEHGTSTVTAQARATTPFPLPKEITNAPKKLTLVNESMGIYRSAQPDKKAFRSLSDHGFKSVLNLRNHNSDLDLLKGTEMKEYRLKVNAGDLTESEILDALTILKQAPKPILVHCWHGADRTGTVIAASRIVFDGWTVDDALKEMRKQEFGFHELVYPNLPKLLKSIDWEKMKKNMADADSLSTQK